MMDVLYVPVHVEALVVGEGGQRVKNMRPSFSALERMPIGAAARVAPDDVTVLKAGVHLHWTMPDALLHGVQEGDNIKFPILPDRWVIQRLAARGEQIERRVWQIAANAVHLYDPDEEYGNSSVTIPMYKHTAGGWMPCGPVPAGKSAAKPYGYLGHCELLGSDGSFPEPEMTVPLTAVGWGEPQFAAAYQKCASCFGFWDEITEKKEVQYTYTVCGYYASQEDEPLGRAPGKLAQFSWFIADEETDAALWRTVCHGAVCGVAWPGAGVKVKDGVPEGEAEISVGNNSAEAAAAFLQGHYPNERGMERLLLYCQQDLWELAAGGGADELILAEEESHRLQFSDIFNGYRYELERTDEKKRFDPLEKGDYLGLEQLNGLQEDLERMKARQHAYAQRLYVFWCRYIYVSGLMDGDDYEKELSDCLEKMKETSRLSVNAWEEAKALETEVSAFAERLQEQIGAKDTGKNLRIVRKERERGYEPNPPVIAVHGAGVQRSYRQGYQADENGRLPCRRHTVTRVTLECGEGEKTVTIRDAREHITEKPVCMPDFCEDIALETVLLDEGLRSVLFGGLPDGCRQGHTADAANGIRPFGLAFSRWRQPWNPLELVWEVSAAPSIRRFGEEDILLEYFLGDIDFEEKSSISAEPLKAFNVSGSTLLTPQGAYAMKERLAALTGEGNPMLAAVERQNMLSQQAEGFYEDCLGRKDTFQIPLYWGKWKEQETGISLYEMQKGIREPVFEPNLSVHSQYLPIRSGTGKITKLWIVDSFGQIKEVHTSKKEAKVHIAESLKCGEQKTFLLTPRFLSPCALNARWLCAKKGLRDAVTPETTPVCGFVRPDLVNKSLAFYDSCGNALGSLETAGAGCHFTPFDKKIDEPGQFPDAVLRQFAERLSADVSALRELLDYLGRHYESRLGEGSGFYQLCFGRVLALARLSVNVSAIGDYARRLVKDAAESHIGHTQKGGRLCYETNGYEKCRFRVRMGDERKCNDGLAGFFLAQPEGEMADMSNMYAADVSAAARGSTFILAENEWEHALDSPAQVLTLLFDPFSEISLRTGLLPARKLKLEEYFFRESAERMETVFPVRPILHPASSVQMPMPDSESGKWEWLDPGSERFSPENKVNAPVSDLYSGRKKIGEGLVKLH